jgi:hypothetical protein
MQQTEVFDVDVEVCTVVCLQFRSRERRAATFHHFNDLLFHHIQRPETSIAPMQPTSTVERLDRPSTYYTARVSCP